ncbi:MAG: lipocalin family protein [Muribaculaceae bacterium]|nr:lipocalin family protein [Muribaculaceae bacterium]
MKKYFKLLMVALFATLSFALVSCGDDDDDNSALIGTWESSSVDPDDGWVYYEAITFNKDNTFYGMYAETYHGQTESEEFAGTYAVNGNLKDGAAVTLTYVEDGYTESVTNIVRIDGKKMYLIDEDGDTGVYTKK